LLYKKVIFDFVDGNVCLIQSVKTGISFYRVDIKALDAAYSIAFPKSTPINVNKKKST
jgi:hypothetical protein